MWCILLSNSLLFFLEIFLFHFFLLTYLFTLCTYHRHHRALFLNSSLKLLLWINHIFHLRFFTICIKIGVHDIVLKASAESNFRGSYFLFRLKTAEAEKPQEEFRGYPILIGRASVFRTCGTCGTSAKIARTFEFTKFLRTSSIFDIRFNQ